MANSLPGGIASRTDQVGVPAADRGRVMKGWISLRKEVRGNIFSKKENW